jgi:hypothetical protein
MQAEQELPMEVVAARIVYAVCWKLAVAVAAGVLCPDRIIEV